MNKWTTNKDFLREIPVPEKTKSYSPVPHSIFIDELQENIAKAGYVITHENYLPASKGEILTGMLTVAHPDSSIIQPSVHFVNSYNKTKVASIRAAALVLVCKNGMMGHTTKSFYKRKHSGDVLDELRKHILLVISEIENEFQRLKKNMEEMTEIHLSKGVMARLVGDMYMNENLITSTQLSILKKECKNSEYFKSDTLWDFYNNLTESFKDNHPMLYDKQMVKMHSYISDKFALSGHTGLYGEPIIEPKKEIAIDIPFEEVTELPLLTLHTN